MAVLDIVTYPDERLKQKCQPVGEVTSEISTLINDMVETMYAAPGVGLAAPQVGHNIRLLVMDASGPEERNDLRVFINPELEFLGELIVSTGEGCLSVPYNFRADVKRYERVRVRALDAEGNAVDDEFDDFAAIVLQHEFDHLEGTLFIDHISRLRRTLYDAKVKKCLKRSA